MNYHLLAICTALATYMMSKPIELLASPEGELDQRLLEEIRKNSRMDDIDRARFNAVSNTDINRLALNRDIVRGEDGHFSHRIAAKGISNQKASGR